MAFDGIVTKAIASELQQLSGARIDKIFQPSKNNVILGLYLDGKNYALNINIDSQYYRINLTTHDWKNPQVAPNFCMLLRKHLIGLRIKNIITQDLERIVTIEFEGFDDVDDIINKKLIVELMGKHCNIILIDDQNTIIDSIRHINSENSSRVIIPHVKYNYPKISKFNFMECTDFNSFITNLYSEKNISQTDLISIDSFTDVVSNSFNGISKRFLINSIKRLNINQINNNTIETIFNYTKKIIDNTDSFKLDFEIILNKNNVSTDYFLIPVDKNNNNFSLNFFIDDFYYKTEAEENFKTYRNNILKIILGILKKYQHRLLNINDKLKACDEMDIYKLYGELITANLYRIPNKNLDNIKIENYYDNNNLISIPLDSKYTPSINAKNFFKKYNKLKNALEIVTIQKYDTEKELNYMESIVYELEAATTIDEIADIFEEISENVIFKDKITYENKKKNTKIKKSKLTQNKNVSFNPLKYNVDGYTLLVGRNNKENDYLTLKYAKKTDLWLHTKDLHGSHAILQLDNQTISDDIIIKCAQIVAFHSKAKNSSNVPVDVCFVKYVKKPNGAKPGMVVYTNNKTFNVNPKNY